MSLWSMQLPGNLPAAKAGAEGCCRDAQLYSCEIFDPWYMLAGRLLWEGMSCWGWFWESCAVAPSCLDLIFTFLFGFATAGALQDGCGGWGCSGSASESVSGIAGALVGMLPACCLSAAGNPAQSSSRNGSLLT